MIAGRSSNRGLAGASRPRVEQSEPGGDCKTDTGREGVDGEILKPRVSSRRPKLKDFESSDHQNRDDRREQPVSWIGEAERQSDQNKSERVLAVLTEIGVRAVPRRSQRGNGYRCREQPGGEAKNDCHAGDIA